MRFVFSCGHAAPRRLIGLQSPQQSQEPGMGRVTRAGVVGVAALTALVTGCSSASADEAFALQLQPVGDQGAWLDNAYAAGTDDEYSTESTVCGISDGLIIESAEAQVTVTSLSTGEAVFEVAEVSCGAWSAGGGLVPLLLDGSWQLLDLEGEMSVTPLEFAEEPESLAIVAVADDVAVAADAADGTLVGFSGGSETWRIDGDSGLAAVPLAGGLLGVTRASGSLSVIDAASGEVLHEQSVGGASSVTWSSDGFVLQEAGEAILVELDGTERSRADAAAQSIVPGTYAGVTVSLDDHAAASNVVAVSADGAPVLALDGSAVVSADGAIDGLAAEQMLAVSADGSTVLFIRNNQLVLQEIGADELMPIRAIAGSVRIADGLIVIEGTLSTVVMGPAG